MTSPKTGNKVLAQLKRVMADYDNFKKRVTRDQLEFVKYSNRELLTKLLPVLDDLERAEAHVKDEGLSLAIKHLHEVLSAEGVIELEVICKTYDPTLAEATETVDGPKDQVVEVVRKGYKLNDQILRPAQVKVGSGTSNRNPEPVEGSHK